MQVPNFFMLGFPKCGTTAMANYLASNPQVFFSRPKEIFFWNSDVPTEQEIYDVTTVERYLKFFEAAGPQHRAVGEGSTTYIFSAVAAERILDFNPSARILVMVRNPVKMIQSWHHECVYNFLEDVPDFEVAWSLQGRRAEGHDVPRTCKYPKLLQYREIGTFADYLEPLTKIVPPAQLKVVVLEEFAENPRAHYADVCQFLGINDDGRTEFPPARESQGHAWPALSKLIWHPPKWLAPVARAIRLRSGQKPTGVLGNVKRVLCRRKKQRPGIKPEFEQYIRETFAAENKRLESLLGRQLDLWV